MHKKVLMDFKQRQFNLVKETGMVLEIIAFNLLVYA